MQIHEEDVEHLLHSPASYLWVRPLRNVEFVKDFHVYLHMFHFMPRATPLSSFTEEERELQARYTQRLRDLLIPGVLADRSTDNVLDRLGPSRCLPWRNN